MFRPTQLKSRERSPLPRAPETSGPDLHQRLAGAFCRSLSFEDVIGDEPLRAAAVGQPARTREGPTSTEDGNGPDRVGARLADHLERDA